jgi:capsular exopolysaccharide synthesis family protein
VLMRVRVSVEAPISSPSETSTQFFEEAFRTLRSNLLVRVREGDKAFLVTSAKPGEGKSTVAVNLAHVLAAGKRKVLLVDADLRRPRLHELFGIGNRQGLTDLLTEVAPPNAFYQDVGGGLTVLTSGALPCDPQELFLGDRFESIAGLMKNDFDVVLFDSAPVLAFADTTLLAPKMDGVILVLKSGEVTTAEGRVVRERLQSVHARLAGCVLTGVPNSHLQPYHPYASQYIEEAVPESRLDARLFGKLSPTQGTKL